MVTINRQLDSVFGALSDATRRAILEELARGERTVGELAHPFDISRPAISKHLRVLEEAGLLERRKEGRTHHCQLRPEPLGEAAEWIEEARRFWGDRLDALAQFLEQTNDDTGNDKEPKK